VGFTLKLPTGLHNGLTRDTAACIIAEMPSELTAVVITYVTSAHETASLIRETGALAVQLHGGMSKTELTELTRLVPGVKKIGRVSVTDRAAIETARGFSPDLWDAVILDTYDPETGKLGATGRTHDWGISADIVKAAHVPVILAGGLNAENVERAVGVVRPHGVDAHTGVENEDGTRNFGKIRRFTRAALDAFRRIGII
jgi:phosphoribosylanthranilate isomerase